MKKIESLMDAQKARIPEYVQEWTAIGLSTAPADRYAAGRAIFDVYRCAGLKPPNRVVWHESPLAMLKRDVSAELAERAGQPASMNVAKPRPLSECIYGQHDAGWLSFYAFMREVVGLREQTEKVTGLIALARCAGWAMPYENACHVSERHSVLKRDNSGRLHCLTGPAVAYPDGWGVYAVRGVRVPKEWIEKRETLDPMIALTDPNLERRAAAATIIGWDKVLEKLSPTVVDTETSEQYDYGQLLRVDLPDEPGQQFLKVLCATGRTMVLRVPPNMRTAREANAWTNGFDSPSEFKPEVRT